jgi:valyl-tRNA synthetase
MNSFGLHYQGKDRFVVREEIAKELETTALSKNRNHLNKVGTLKEQSCYRTNYQTNGS